MKRVWGLMLTGLLALPAQAAGGLPVMGPGRLVGSVHDILRPAGMTINQLASQYGVHPIRILWPSRDILRREGRHAKRLLMDQRRIEPRFSDRLTGVVLNIPEAQLYRVENGRILRDYPVGVSRSDWQAPIGASRVVSMEKNPIWYVPKSIQKEMLDNGREVIEKVDAGPGNPLGTRWIGFSNGNFGIHGTNDPSSIKRNVSHGCVRMLDPHLRDLYATVYVGMPVYVYYQPVKLAVSAQAIWLAVFPDIYGLKPDLAGAVRALALQAGVVKRVNWKAVQRAMVDPDGIVVDVGIPDPHMVPSPRHTPPVRVTPRPSPGRSVLPLPGRSPSPRIQPSAQPSWEPLNSDPSATPAVGRDSPLGEPTRQPPALQSPRVPVPTTDPTGRVEPAPVKPLPVTTPSHGQELPL